MPILLKNLIKEVRNDRRESISSNDAIDLIKTNCKKALNLYKQGKKLYRGLRKSMNDNNTPYYYINPKTSERYSRDSFNLYTVLFGWLPSWKGWPKRNYSMFLINDRDTAKVFGNNMYLVFPYDGAKIVESDVNDLLSSAAFPYAKGKLRTSTDVLAFYEMRELFRKIDESFYRKWMRDLNTINESNINQFMDELNDVITLEKMENLLKSTPLNPSYFIVLTNIIDMFPKNVSNPWTVLFDDLLDPVKNGLKLLDITGLSFKEPLELWTDSECVMVGELDIRIIDNI